MIEKTTKISTFQRRVLGCVKDIKQTAQEIREDYILFFPQGRIAKKIIPPASVTKVESALKVLTMLGFVDKDLTRFTDKPLKVDTEVYSISAMGRSFLNPKKR